MKIYINLVVFILISTSIASEAKTKSSNSTKIIEIKRTLSLNNDKRHHKEFYINAGKDKGLKTNHVIPVVRRKSFYDPLLNKTMGDLFLPVGEIKVIHVGSKVSVARIYKVPGRKDLPEIEYPTFMIGDRIQTKKAKFIKKKSTSKTAKSNRGNKKSKNKRGIASLPGRSTSSKSRLKSKMNFGDKIRTEIGKPTTFKGRGSSESGGSASSSPSYLTE